MNAFHRWLCRSSAWRRALQNQILPWALNNVDLGPELLEIGAGPGLATEWLRRGSRRLTAVEIDSGLAVSLGRRLCGTNVAVVQGDGTKLPFADASFTGSVCFTMLHHIPSEKLQNQLLGEVRRVLKPGGVFAGSDSRWSRGMQLIHIRDTMVIVDPVSFPARLEAAGFVDIRVEPASRAFRFFARRPPNTGMPPAGS